MRRMMTLLLALGSALFGGATIVAEAAQAIAVGHARAAIDSAAAFPDYSSTAGHEQVVILQPWDTTDLYSLKAANPAVKVLMYKNTSAASSTSSASGVYPSGVSYSQASANGWLLQDTSGSTFTFNGYSWLWAADMGLAGYQNAWAANVIKELQSAPWDGVFMDDVNPTIKYHYCVTCVAKYPSDDLYGGATQSFVQNVGPQIQAAGKLAIANVGSWSSYGSVVDPWLQYLSGGMDEMFLKWGTTTGSGYASPGVWATQLQEIKLAESEGKLFIGITHSANTDEQAAVYAYATALLAGNSHTMVYMGADSTNETWFPEYNYAIGDPTGPESVDANGVHRRVFSNGLALVNPTTSSQTVTLPGTYSGSGLTSVSTVTMAPQTGLVLTPDATSTAPSSPPASTTPHPASTTPPPASTTPPGNSSAPTISGTAVTGQTLTASAGTWSGSPSPSTSYQWNRCSTTSASSCTPISGNTGSTYVVQAADAGDYINVTVTGTNSAGSATASSAESSQVPVPTFSLSASPSTQSVRRGYTAKYTITVKAQNGWNGAAALRVTGLPSGTKASFSSSSTSTTSTLSVSTSRWSVGMWRLTISGTSGSTSSTALTLTVK